MPLIQSKTNKAFEKNVKTERHSGKPEAQALAIAYSLKRRAAKKAQGGMVEDDEDQTPEQIEMEAKSEGEPLSQELDETRSPDHGEDESPEMEAAERERGDMKDPKAIAKAIGARKMSQGGAVESRDDAPNLKEKYDEDEDMFSDMDSPEDLDELFESDNDFLSRDRMASGGEVEEPQRKKEILKKIMSRLHNDHAGK